MLLVVVVVVCSGVDDVISVCVLKSVMLLVVVVVVCTGVDDVISVCVLKSSSCCLYRSW